MGGVAEFSSSEPHNSRESLLGAASAEVISNDRQAVDDLLEDRWYRREVAANLPSYGNPVDHDAFLHRLIDHSNQNSQNRIIAENLASEYFELDLDSNYDPVPNERPLTREAILASIDREVDDHFMRLAMRPSAGEPDTFEPDKLARQILGMNKLIPGAYVPRVMEMIVAREQMRMSLEAALVNTNYETEVVETERESVSFDMTGGVVAAPAYETSTQVIEKEVVHEPAEVEVDEGEFVLGSLAAAVAAETRARVGGLSPDQREQFKRAREAFAWGGIGAGLAGEEFSDITEQLPDEAAETPDWFGGVDPTAFGAGARSDVYADVPADVETWPGDAEAGFAEDEAFNEGYLGDDELQAEAEQDDDATEAEIEEQLQTARTEAMGVAVDYRNDASYEEPDAWTDDDLGSQAAFEAFVADGAPAQYVAYEAMPASYYAEQVTAAETDLDQTFQLQIPMSRRVEELKADRQRTFERVVRNDRQLTVADIVQDIKDNAGDVELPAGIERIVNSVVASVYRSAEGGEAMTAIRLFELIDDHASDHIRNTSTRAHGIKNRVVRWASRKERTKDRLKYEATTKNVRDVFFGKKPRGAQMAPVGRRQAAA